MLTRRNGFLVVSYFTHVKYVCGMNIPYRIVHLRLFRGLVVAYGGQRSLYDGPLFIRYAATLFFDRCMIE